MKSFFILTAAFAGTAVGQYYQRLGACPTLGNS
jgi:hypothetical protein